MDTASSKVTFNAQVGQEYQLAIDGLKGAQGEVVLSWQMELTTDRVPMITSISDGQTVGVGEQVTYAVSVDQSSVSYQWFFNNHPLPGQNYPTLTYDPIQPTNAGNYMVVVSNETGLGIIPLGTGNALALDLGIPNHPAKAARMQLEAEPRRLLRGLVAPTLADIEN